MSSTTKATKDTDSTDFPAHCDPYAAEFNNGNDFNFNEARGTVKMSLASTISETLKAPKHKS